MNYPKPNGVPKVPRHGLADNPIEADVTVNASVTVPAQDINGLVGKAAGGDFTTAYQGASTITVGALPDTSALAADDITAVVQIDSTGGVVQVYGRGDADMSIAGGVLTVAGATFAASDSFVIYTNIARDVAVDTTGLATEATQAGMATDIASLEGKDFATETTLASILADTATIDSNIAAILADTAAMDTNLASLAAEDFATEATLAAVAADVASLEGKDFATQTTLAALNSKDFATQTTLASALTSLQLLDDVVATVAAAVPTKGLVVGGSDGTNFRALNMTTTGVLNVLVTQNNPGSAATNLGKAIDAAVGANDVGVAMLVKRVDSLSTLTPANGDYVTPQTDNQGAMWVRNSVINNPSYQKSNITTATTSNPKSGPGLLHAIVINTAVASGVITIYDNTSASGTLIGTITLPATLTNDHPMTILYDCNVQNGITIVTSAAFNLTVMYQ